MDRRGDVLFIDANADELALDRLDIGAGLSAGIPLLRTLVGERQIVYVRVKSHADLKACWSEFSGLHFDRIILTGHGNRAGVHLAPEHESVTPWLELGQMFAELHPSALWLVSCRGLSVQSAEELFTAIPSLYDLYGSPTKLSPRGVLALLSLWLGMDLKAAVGISPKLALAAAALTKEFVFHVYRDDVFDPGWRAAVESLEDDAVPLMELARDWLLGRVR